MRRLFRFIVTTASIAVLAAVVLGFLGHVAFSLDVLAHFRLHFLLLCPILALFAVALRHWAAFWRVVATAVLAMAGLGVLWEQIERPGGTTELTIMAANLYQRNAEPQAMQQMLLDADADVLVTMETSKAVLSGERSLSLRYPYRLSLSTSGSTLRTVIWSRFPMRDGQLLLEDQVEPTGAHAIIELSPEIDFTVLGVHFAHNPGGNQKRQIEALDRIAEGLLTPRIVLGDFNATPWSYAMRRVEALTATTRVGGFRLTWRGAYPTPFGQIQAPMGMSIDHALVSDGIGVRWADTIAIPGSDHWAVRVRVAIPDGQG